MSVQIFVLLCLISSAPAQQPPPAVPAPPLPPSTSLPPVPAPPPNSVSVQPAFSVVLDPAHGGANIGARISEKLLEKDLDLALSTRLRSALAAHGITAVTTREADSDLTPDERAAIANHAKASACLVLHATASGSGVHLFTSSLQPAPGQTPGVSPPPNQSLVPWATAQAGWITRSLRLSSEINSALGQAGIPVTLGSTSLEPLDHLTCPAVAIEIAPLVASPANKAALLSDPKYQQRVLDALLAAILSWSTDWRQQP